MKCKICKEEIRVGEHVYPSFNSVRHTKCDLGIWPAVMGSDGKLRWLNNQEVIM